MNRIATNPESDAAPLEDDLDDYLSTRSEHRLRKARLDPEIRRRREAAASEWNITGHKLLQAAESITDWRSRMLAEPFAAKLWHAFGPSGRVPLYTDHFWEGLPINANRVAWCCVTLDGDNHAFHIEEWRNGSSGSDLWSKSVGLTRPGEFYDRNIHPELIRRLADHLRSPACWVLALQEIAAMKRRYAPVG